jgi:hypothetical protein
MDQPPAFNMVVVVMDSTDAGARSRAGREAGLALYECALGPQDRWLARPAGYGPPGAVVPQAPPAPAPAPPPEPPPSAPTPEGAASALGGLRYGEVILVRLHGAYFLATLVAPAGSSFRVKLADGIEEQVLPDRIVRASEPPKGGRYEPNQPVLIEYKGVFFAGWVQKQEGKGDYRVRFDGQGPDADEVVPARRLRPR